MLKTLIVLHFSLTFLLILLRFAGHHPLVSRWLPSIKQLGFDTRYGTEQIWLLWHVLVAMGSFVYGWSLFLPYYCQGQKSDFSYEEVFFSFGEYAFPLLLDPVSNGFVLLTLTLTPLCILASYYSSDRDNNLLGFYFLLLEGFCLLAFLVPDLFLFYIFFEIILLPMFIIINWWGSSARRTLAAMYFVMFTLAGSLGFLCAIIYIFYFYGVSDVRDLLYVNFSYTEQRVLAFLFFFAFAIKIPMVPFHLWLPEAHVEAPTSASMFLAGVLLKIGAYGFMRFVLPSFPVILTSYFYLVAGLAAISALAASWAAFSQIDLKKIVAYSSIAHMNFALIGVFCASSQGILGGYVVFIGHGFVSSGLFFLIGVLYDRHKTRLISNFSGLVTSMPLFAFYLFFLLLANTDFPGTVNFWGEFLIMQGIVEDSSAVAAVAGTAIFFSCLYTYVFIVRVLFGTPDPTVRFDLTDSEHFIIFIHMLIIVVLGLKPSLILFLLGGFGF